MNETPRCGQRGVSVQQGRLRGARSVFLFAARRRLADSRCREPAAAGPPVGQRLIGL
jgi:hypothetical protein